MQADSLIGRIWRYSHTYDHVGKLIKLAQDGRIVGYDHPNERRWDLRGDTLYFLSERGTDTASFKVIPDALGRLTLGGDLVGDPAANIKTMLQILPDDREYLRQSAYDIADHVHLIAGEAKVDALEHLYGTHHEQGYTARQVDLLELSDVNLRTRYAVIEKDGKIAGESLFHFPFFKEPFMSDGGDGHSYWMRDQEPSVEIDVALHAFGGVSGNYYHWLHFFIAKMNSQIIERWEGERPVVLLPAYLSETQRESAEVVARRLGLRVVSVTGNSAIRVRKLLFPHQRGSEGLDIHPAMLEAFRSLRDHFLTDGDYPSKIYISRSDTSNRPLVGEADIEAHLKRLGFEIISFTGRDLAYQINVMAHADYIIGPHGAGLTNLIFCKPGAKVLEFQSPGHFNWCMARSAALSEAYYGSIVGKMRPDHAVDAYDLDWGSFTRAVESMLDAGRSD